MSNTASGPRFYLITNDAPRAALLVNCHMGNLPGSIAVVDDPFAFAHVPDGAKYRCFFWGTRDVVANWEGFWWARKGRGGVEGISEEEWSRIQAWANDPKRPSPVSVAERPLPEDEGGDAPAPAIASPPQQEATASASAPNMNQPVEPVKRKARWS
ncbi:MAG: hypothetical protein JWR80_7984 [Bradyrhizobium sp.]|nr:hypothetical protein [Bradyrhizobium sp.]